MPRCWMLVSAIALAACTHDTTVDLDDFDRSCASDQDCALVLAAPCGCACEEVAIRASELDRYYDEFTAKQEHCDQESTCPTCLPVNEPICKASVCAVK